MCGQEAVEDLETIQIFHLAFSVFKSPAKSLDEHRFIP